MDSKRLELAETTDDAAWDAWTEQSDQGTVFSKSAFLRSLNVGFRMFVVMETGSTHRPVALVPVIEDGAGNAVRFPFTPYQGILFLTDPRAASRQKVFDEFRITEFAIGVLIERYREIGIALSWKFQDIRPFLWHNHGRAGAPRFVPQPRYTAVLDLESLDAQTYPAQVRASRRQELKKSSSHPVQEEFAHDDFLALYAKTFARQGIEVDSKRLALVRSVTAAAVAQGYGRLAACRTPDGLAAASLFLYDSKRAYYLFAANDPAQRDTGASTRLMFDNILEAKRRGLAELDFVGVNSPARGDFKLSFNPELRLYFELDYSASPQRAVHS